MASPSIPHRTVGEPVATYVVDSWDRLAQLPFAGRPGQFSISHFPPQTGEAPDTDAAFEQALADAVRRGRPRWLEILGSEGGVVTAGQMATLLGISRQAVDKRRQAGTLLGFRDGGREYLYPVWQVQDGRSLPALERILAALRKGEHNEKAQFLFFLPARARLGGRSALDVLREGSPAGISDVELAAWGYLEHGAI